MVVELTTEDIKAADEHCSTALIVYVLGDTPYEKSMDNFVKNVNFHELPVGYWSQEDLSKVASAVEKPLNTEKYTVDMTRIYYARVLIEMDISHPMVDMIVIETIWIN
ncbi:hypothetical protein BC332_03437 [Capsicum chinense]|nr:hypothetical protein BC332_03437 [Capsicum chinense]